MHVGFFFLSYLGLGASTCEVCLFQYFRVGAITRQLSMLGDLAWKAFTMLSRTLKPVVEVRFGSLTLRGCWALAGLP